MLNFRPHKLYVKIPSSGGGVDENGNPIAVDNNWSDAIPCHFDTDNKETIYRYDNGSATVFDYVVWIDPISDDMTGRMVKLIDEYGNEVSERMVQKCVNGQLRTKLYL